MARSRFRWPQTCTLVLLGGAGLVGGCHKIFGEYEIVEEPPPPPPPTTLCVAGDLRCVGPFLYKCGPGLDTWVYQETCASEARCQSREGGCQICVPGEYRCADTRLELCDESGQWSLEEDCGQADACNLNSHSCRTCTPDETECRAGNPMRCTSEGTWLPLAECEDGQPCTAKPETSTAACAAVDARCTAPRMHVCDGPQLLRCTDFGDELIPVESCARADLCDAAAADRQADAGLLGTCLEACDADAVRCVDAEFQRCAEGRWESVISCGAASACSARVGATGCEQCVAGTLECNDGELRRCAPESESGWETVADCGAARLCNLALGQCDTGLCPAAGQTRCEEGPKRCRADQSDWETIDICSPELCNANDAKCETAACAKDARRCWQGNLERCNESLRGWDLLEECTAGETCSLDGCSSSGCTNGDFRCNDVYLERCADGTWERAEHCATAGLCDATAQTCRPPECEANAFNCDGTQRIRCRTDRSGYDPFGGGDCADAQRTCDKYTGKCR